MLHVPSSVTGIQMLRKVSTVARIQILLLVYSLAGGSNAICGVITDQASNASFGCPQ